MKKFFICFIIFVVTGLASAFVGAPGEATFVIGGICALLYLIFSRKKRHSSSQKSSQKTSTSYSSYSSSRNGYYTKKYSHEDVARLLASNNLYACRFEDGSNLKRIDFVTRAKIICRSGTWYVAFPNYISGEYKLEHGYSHIFKGGYLLVNEGGDNFYLMDKDKNLILY